MDMSRVLPLLPKPLCEAPQWGAWSLTVRSTLRAHNLLEHLTSSGPAPPNTTSSTTAAGDSSDTAIPSTTTSPTTADSLTTLATWRTNDYRVVEWLIRCLGEGLVLEVGMLSTAQAIWKRLSERFEQRSGARAAHLFHQVWTTRRAGAPIIEHIGHLQRSWTELRSMQPHAGSTHDDWVAWSERQEVYQLFASMPEHNALATQLFSQREFPSLSEAIAAVCHQETLQQSATARANYGVAPPATTELPLLATPAPPTYPTGYATQCSHCHRQNHRVENCWLLHPELQITFGPGRGRGRNGGRGRGRGRSHIQGYTTTSATTVVAPPSTTSSPDLTMQLQIIELQRQYRDLAMTPGYITSGISPGSALPSPSAFPSGSSHGQDSWRWF